MEWNEGWERETGRWKMEKFKGSSGDQMKGV
jgi:hypothetical protein